MLRLEHAAKWEDSGCLWTQEPELYLSGGKVLMPRLKIDVDRNNRLNSGRRPILADLDPRKETLSLSYDGGNPFFGATVEQFVLFSLDSSETSVKVQVHYSLAKALRIGRLGFYHLVQGNVVGSSDNTLVVALSDSNASHIQVPSHQVIHIGNGEERAESLLLGILANIVATTLMSDLVQSSAVLVFEPASFLC